MLPGESVTEFKALEAALIEELAPEGALQSVLAQRVVAAWRLERAERIEAELFAREMHGLFGDGDFGLALIRDGNGARAFDTLLRYRGTTLAEFWRALRTLKALQAERAAARPEPDVVPAPRLLAEPREMPIEPESRANPGNTEPPRAEAEPAQPLAATRPAATPCGRVSAPTKLPDEPESPKNPGDSGRPGGRAVPRRGDRSPAEPARSLPIEVAERGASLLAGTALVPIGRRR